MKLFQYFAIFLFELTFSAANDITKLIIDTDAGSDDAVAIFNILGAEDLFHQVQVQFITTVNGNTNVDNVGRNVLKVLKTSDRLDIPVYKGARQSLLVKKITDDFFGKDGFGDFHFPDPPSEDLIKKSHAVNALIEAVSLNPGELSLLCLGPLTNIALAIRMYPQFLSNLKEIYVLGGSDTGLGNVVPGVEFNVYVDPDSAFIVFQSAKESNKLINLITWDTVYKRSTIDSKWRKEVLGVIKSPQIQILNLAEQKILNRTLWLSPDAIASSVVLDSSIVDSFDKYYAAVETCGTYSKGMIVIDHENYQKFNKNIKIIKSINVEKFKHMLLENLNPKRGSTNGATKIL